MDLQALLSGKPFLSNKQVIQLVEEKFNIEVKLLKPLDGYDNQNFLVEGSPIDDGNDRPGRVTRRYSLKITNSKLSEDFDCLKDATYMMQYLRGEGFSCPQPLSSKDANIYELVKCKNLALHGSGDDLPLNRRSEDTFMVRMLTFLPGKTLNELTVVPDNIFEEMGENLARVHTAFQSMKLDHKPMMEFGDRFIWSLNNVHSLHSFLHVVEDAEQKQMIKEVLDDFQTKVLQRRKDLPQGFIHGDYNDVNILVDQTAADIGGEVHMSGFIDFDDAYYGCTVFDIGIAVMYALQSKTASRDKAVALFLKGYGSVRRLNQLEKSCLYYCTAARFAQSLVFGLVNYASSKDEYVLGTQVRGWEALQEMWDRGQTVTYQKWEFLGEP